MWDARSWCVVVRIVGIVVLMLGVVSTTSHADSVLDEDHVDRLWFSDGLMLEGQIVAEDGEHVVLLMELGSSIQELMFKRSAIQIIDYDQFVPERDRHDQHAFPQPPTHPRGLCIIPLEGEVGYDVAYRPLYDALQSVQRYDVRYVVLRLNVTDTYHWSLENLITTVEYYRREWDGVRDPQIVLWIERAFDSRGLTEYAGPHVYFTRDGVLTDGDDTIDAASAIELGLSDGTADTLGELADALDLPSYRLVVGAPQRIMERWQIGLKHELPKIDELRESIDHRIEHYAGSYEMRERARSEIRRDLDRLEGYIRRYEEVLEPGRRDLLDVEMWRARLRRDARLDREARDAEVSAGKVD